MHIRELHTENVFEEKRSGKRGGGVLPFLMDFCCWKKNIFKRQMCAYFCELMLRSNIYFFFPSVYSYLLRRREISGKGFVVFLKVVLSFRENFVCVKIQVLIFMGGCFWSMCFRSSLLGNIKNVFFANKKILVDSIC